MNHFMSHQRQLKAQGQWWIPGLGFEEPLIICNFQSCLPVVPSGIRTTGSWATSTFRCGTQRGFKMSGSNEGTKTQIGAFLFYPRPKLTLNSDSSANPTGRLKNTQHPRMWFYRHRFMDLGSIHQLGLVRSVIALESQKVAQSGLVL